MAIEWKELKPGGSEPTIILNSSVAKKTCKSTTGTVIKSFTDLEPGRYLLRINGIIKSSSTSAIPSQPYMTVTDGSNIEEYTDEFYKFGRDVSYALDNYMYFTRILPFEVIETSATIKVYFKSTSSSVTMTLDGCNFMLFKL